MTFRRIEQANLRRIFFSDELPREGKGMLIHCDHEPVAVAGWVTCDVREIIGINEDAWLSEIDSWCRKLSSQAIGLTRWWWLLPGSRLILWATTTHFSLKPILFALAIVQLCARQSTKTVWIVGAPDELVAYLSEWATSEKSIQIEDNRLRTPGSFFEYRFFCTVKFWLKLTKQIALVLRCVRLRKRKKCAEPASVIVNSLILNPELILKNGDHFFGHMLDNNTCLNDGDLAWFYNDVGLSPRETRAELEKTGKKAYFISDFFKWSDLWFALRKGYRANRALKKLLLSPPSLCVGGLVAKKFSYDFINNLALGSIPIFELIIYRQFSRIIRESGAKVLLYPYEEKPLERAMLLAVQDYAPTMTTIGFGHAAYSKGHLYLRRAHHDEPPRPDFIAVTGETARDNFEKAGVPVEQIVVIGSPRYCKLAQEASGFYSKARRKLLLLIGYGFELRIFAALIESKPDLFNNYELIVRRYPYAWFEEQDAAELRLQAAGIVYRCVSGDLMTQIDESDIVIFESTSAGMEAVLRGKMVIRFNLSDCVSTDHFYGSDGQDEIKYCHNVDELEILLKDINSLTSSQYAMAVQRQRELVVGLYSPVDQSAVVELLTKKKSHEFH